MACTTTTTTTHHTRSASFPPKSNPVVIKIEQELKKLQKLESTSDLKSPMETVTTGLSGLAGLYSCLDDVVLSCWTDKYTSLEGSSELLDICASARGILVNLREAVSNGDASVYYSERKETVRSARALALRLREVEAKLCREEELSEVSKVVRCVSIIAVSVLDTLLGFLAVPVSKKPSMMSKLVSKKSRVDTGNELSDVDAMFSSAKGGVAEEKLEALEVALRGVENGLCSVALQLTRIRGSLVRTVSF